MAPLPILLFSESFWRRVVDFDELAAEGVISPNDIELFRFVETAEEAWAHVEAHYRDMAPIDK
jgi:predicted Rossmann-fold nucleotide-binding protein